MKLFFDSLQESSDILRLFTINVLFTNRSCVNESLVFTCYMYKPPIIQKGKVLVLKRYCRTQRWHSLECCILK